MSHCLVVGCITRDYEGSPITGKCWYGDLSMPCNETELYVDKCSDQSNPEQTQKWDFVPVSEDEVLIQAYNEDRCMERMQRNITMQSCDATNARQRWFAVGGGFNEARFEISQKLAKNYCVRHWKLFAL